MKKFVLPVAIISMITIVILMMSWCDKEQDNKITPDYLTSLNHDINIQEKEVLNKYDFKVKKEAELSWAVSERNKSEDELQILYIEKREYMTTKKDSILSFTGDRE